MELTLTTTTAIKVTIEFPYYMKYGDYVFFKFFDESNSIQVDDFTSSFKVEVRNGGGLLAAFFKDSEPISPAKFNDVYLNVLDKLKTSINQPNEPQPALQHA